MLCSFPWFLPYSFPAFSRQSSSRARFKTREQNSNSVFSHLSILIPPSPSFKELSSLSSSSPVIISLIVKTCQASSQAGNCMTSDIPSYPGLSVSTTDKKQPHQHLLLCSSLPSFPGSIDNWCNNWTFAQTLKLIGRHFTSYSNPFLFIIRRQRQKLSLSLLLSLRNNTINIVLLIQHKQTQPYDMETFVDGSH